MDNFFSWDRRKKCTKLSDDMEIALNINLLIFISLATLKQKFACVEMRLEWKIDFFVQEN